MTQVVRAASFKVDGIWYRMTSDNTVEVIPIQPDSGEGGTSFFIQPTYEGDIMIPATVMCGKTTCTVTSVEEGAFRNSLQLTSISLPATLTNLGVAPFAKCSKLERITVADENAVYQAVGGMLYDKKVTTLITCPAATSGDVVLPSTLTAIAPSAFYGCSKVNSITIPSTVDNIGIAAFYNCSGLTSLLLPEGVSAISDSVCYGCTNLTSITIPSTVASIGEKAFAQCKKVKNFSLPASLKTIGRGAFILCYGMSSITMPENLEEIGEAAFENCSKLTSFAIPASVTSVGARAFNSCTSMRNITVADDNPNYCSVSGVLFDKMKTTLLCCPGAKSGEYVVPSTVRTIADYGFYYCKSLKSICLPLSLQSIGSCAFRLCSGLTTIAIPPNVRSLGDEAFVGCSALTSIFSYPNRVPAVTEDAFSANNKSATLYVPSQAVTLYQADENWGEIQTILPITWDVVSGLRGDTNQDGMVNVTDIMQTVNASLGTEPDNFSWQMADVNVDGHINVADIMGIVNIIQ